MTNQILPVNGEKWECIFLIEAVRKNHSLHFGRSTRLAPSFSSERFCLLWRTRPERNQDDALRWWRWFRLSFPAPKWEIKKTSAFKSRAIFFTYALAFNRSAETCDGGAWATHDSRSIFFDVDFLLSRAAKNKTLFLENYLFLITHSESYPLKKLDSHSKKRAVSTMEPLEFTRRREKKIHAFPPPVFPVIAFLIWCTRHRCSGVKICVWIKGVGGEVWPGAELIYFQFHLSQRPPPTPRLLRARAHKSIFDASKPKEGVFF